MRSLTLAVRSTCALASRSPVPSTTCRHGFRQRSHRHDARWGSGSALPLHGIPQASRGLSGRGAGGRRWPLIALPDRRRGAGGVASRTRRYQCHPDGPGSLFHRPSIRPHRRVDPVAPGTQALVVPPQARLDLGLGRAFWRKPQLDEGNAGHGQGCIDRHDGAPSKTSRSRSGKRRFPGGEGRNWWGPERVAVFCICIAASPGGHAATIFGRGCFVNGRS